MNGVFSQPGMPEEQAMPQQGQMPEQAFEQMPPEEEADDAALENTDAIEEAMDLMAQKLYEENVADEIAKIVMAAEDKKQAIVDQASTLFSVIDDVTEGAVPDEQYMLMGIGVVSEVIELVQAAGVEVDSRLIAEAMRDFIVGAMEGIGADMTEIKQMLDQINIDEMAAALDQEAAAWA